MEQIKRNISVRLSTSDKKKMKEISTRLCVKESELFRYAIKNMLTKLMPLSDEKLKGADLIPAWLECGGDLLNYFHMDVEQLDKIFNKNNCEDCVDLDDLDLMILSSLNKKYVVKKLSEICQENIDPADVDKVLQKYLYNKYVVGAEHSSVEVGLAASNVVQKPVVVSAAN